MKTEGEIRAYCAGLKRFKGCCSVPQKNAEIASNLEVLAWVLEEDPEET